MHLAQAVTGRGWNCRIHRRTMCEIVVFALDCQVKYLLEIAHVRELGVGANNPKTIRKPALWMLITSGSFSFHFINTRNETMLGNLSVGNTL